MGLLNMSRLEQGWAAESHNCVRLKSNCLLRDCQTSSYRYEPRRGYVSLRSRRLCRPLPRVSVRNNRCGGNQLEWASLRFKMNGILNGIATVWLTRQGG